MDELREERPSVETFRRLRAAAGTTDRSREAVERGLPNSQYPVVAADIGESTTGDGGTVYHVCDTAVHPDHQGRGLGTRLMDAVMEWITGSAPPTTSVTLMADVDGFYER